MSEYDAIKHKAENASYYARNKEKHLVRNRKRKQAVQDFVREYKETHPCADCGNFYPACVMDFDHLPGAIKSNNIAIMARNSTLPRLLEEIAKCELVCANCHRIRTWITRDLPEGMRSARRQLMAGRSEPVTL